MSLVDSYDPAEIVEAPGSAPKARLRKGLIDPKIVSIIGRERAAAWNVIALFKVRDELTVAMTDSGDLPLIDDLERLTGCEILPVECPAEDIELAIEQYYGEGLKLEEFLRGLEDADAQTASDPGAISLGEDDDGEGVINLVDMIMAGAIERGASDIHIEADVDSSWVRYRVDGVLQEVMKPPLEMHPAIVSRIKIMSKMDIAERRVPQDGRITAQAASGDVDVRVSTMPTVLGEKVVMRLLDQSRVVLDINQIGLRDQTLDDIKGLISRPNGIILVTGPTGSGKTTTLYAGLSFISTIEKNIVTIEDPVEYQLPLISQVQVNEEQGLTFARTLRSVLRQDPDVVMVGEIRDRDTAEVAIQASLTGHLVLSTLHTNESAGAIARLLDMGTEPFLLSSALTAVVAQRLARLVCDRCRTSHFPSPDELKALGLEGRALNLVKGRGCENCLGSGYRGRLPLFELLKMTPDLRRTIASDPSTETIRRMAVESGMRTLRDEALGLIEAGLSSLEEVMRVVAMSEDEQAKQPEQAGA